MFGLNHYYGSQNSKNVPPQRLQTLCSIKHLSTYYCKRTWQMELKLIVIWPYNMQFILDHPEGASVIARALKCRKIRQKGQSVSCGGEKSREMRWKKRSKIFKIWGVQPPLLVLKIEDIVRSPGMWAASKSWEHHLVNSIQGNGNLSLTTLWNWILPINVMTLEADSLQKPLDKSLGHLNLHLSFATD